MTPAVGWSELDYFRASRRARRLGEQHLAQQQIQGVLDDTDAGTVGVVEPAAPLRNATGGPDPHTHEGHGANLDRVARRAQEGS